VEARGGRLFTVAALVQPSGTTRSAKALPAPFAERAFVFGLGAAHVEPGEARALELGPRRLSIPICYELLAGSELRRRVRAERPDVLVSPANDGWTQGVAAELHATFARLRAVEFRRSVALANTTGPSLLVAPSGRVLARIEPGERGVALADLPIASGRTPYLAFGDAPLLLAGLVALGQSLRAFLKRLASANMSTLVKT